MQFGFKSARNRVRVWGARVLIAAVALSGAGCSGSGLATALPTPTGTCGSVQSFLAQEAIHISPGEQHLPYNSNPPSSGPHWAAPQNWGIYTTQQVQEQLVHNLEHGGVIVQYNNLNGAEVQRLVDLVRRDPRHLILAPYPGLPTEAKVALTAWNAPPAVNQAVGRLLYCTGVDENAMSAFISSYRDKAPELVP